MESWIRDLTYGARMLARNPGFTAVVVLTLALGIGANTAMFTAINAVILKPLPVAEPEELVMLYTSREGSFVKSQPSSHYDYVYYRDNNSVFASLAGFGVEVASLGSGQGAEMLVGETVSGNYFEVFGVRPRLGRFFLPEEDATPGTHPVVVISEALWQGRFGSDPDVLGSVVRMNGSTYTVIGVAPQSYTGGMRGFAVDFWVPFMMMDQLEPGRSQLNSRTSRWMFIVGRLNPGVEVEEARANIVTLAEQLRADNPNAGDHDTATLYPAGRVVILPEVDTFIFGAAGLMMALGGAVLLIACANVANLLLARSLARRKEIAIRVSLGAGRGRLVRQLLAESVLLALMAGVVGLVAAQWGAALILAQFTTANLPLDIRIALDMGIDWRVLIFSLLASVGTGIVFGLVPALQSTRNGPASALKDSAGTTTPDRQRSFLRNGLVVSQVALSVLLLVAAGLFIRSLQNVTTIDTGLRTEGVYTAELLPQMQGYDNARAAEFFDRVLERMRSVPGVEDASLITIMPLALSFRTMGMVPEGHPVPSDMLNRPQIGTVNVAPGYFETMGIPLLIGRDFSASDDVDSQEVAIVNSAFVDRFWPGENPIGKTFASGLEGATATVIVGVVADSKYRTLGEDRQAFTYQSINQNMEGTASLIVKAPSAGSAMLATIRDELAAIDENVPVTNIATLEDRMGIVLLLPRLGASLFGGVGLIGLILAATGILGVMSFAVSQRTHDLGVRMALGAGPSTVLGMVLREGVSLTLLGIAAGGALAFGLTRFLSGMLVGVGASDPVTMAGVAIVILGVALTACYIPARRALRVDPVVALREE